MKQETANTLTKPLLRGYFHEWAFYAAIGACTVLILNSQDKIKIIATIIYSLSLIGLFGISALYHRPTWEPRQRMWMRRMDHAAIYILIAGTSTPVCMLALPSETGTKLLQLVWGAAFFGIIQSLFWINAPKWLSALFYVGVGCLVVPFIPSLKTALGSSGLSFIISGGIAYIVGAVIYALKRPNPNPKIFGYHEIFHILVIIGAGFHFYLIYKLI